MDLDVFNSSSSRYDSASSAFSSRARVPSILVHSRDMAPSYRTDTIVKLTR